MEMRWKSLMLGKYCLWPPSPRPPGRRWCFLLNCCLCEACNDSSNVKSVLNKETEGRTNSRVSWGSVVKTEVPARLSSAW